MPQSDDSPTRITLDQIRGEIIHHMERLDWPKGEVYAKVNSEDPRRVDIEIVFPCHITYVKR